MESWYGGNIEIWRGLSFERISRGIKLQRIVSQPFQSRICRQSSGLTSFYVCKALLAPWVKDRWK
jgi:hypothetical protein